MDAFEQAVETYHASLREFVKGNAEPALEMWSQRDDVVLCNPFRPFAHGPAELAETTKAAASNFADGEIASERVGKEGSGALRVTTILRLEEDDWRVCHRHADPITSPQEIGSIVQN